MRKSIDASINESKDKSLLRECTKLIRLMDTMNKTAHTKVDQIKSLVEFGEEVKVSTGDILDITRKLDALFAKIVELKV